MSTNRIDNHIAEKLKNRELSPSASSWERLSMQLDEQEKKKKKHKFLYFGYVASFTLLFFLGYQHFVKTPTIEPKKEIIVQQNVTESPEPTEKSKINIVNENKKEKKQIAVIKKVEEPIKKIQSKNNAIKKEQKTVLLNSSNEIASKVFVNELEKNISEEKTTIKKTNEKKQNKNTFIRVNADDLLYAVTHTQEEVKEYYAKNMINRSSLLDTINVNLKKSNLKVNPEIILAEVENEIYNGDEARESFMKKFKIKLSEVIIAFADRNK